eukprot:1917966-Pleurochrysis_carterae.AAC.4
MVERQQMRALTHERAIIPAHTHVHNCTRACMSPSLSSLVLAGNHVQARSFVEGCASRHAPQRRCPPARLPAHTCTRTVSARGGGCSHRPPNLHLRLTYTFSAQHMPNTRARARISNQLGRRRLLNCTEAL